MVTSSTPGRRRKVERFPTSAKGYRVQKNTYVLLDDADFERAKIELTVPDHRQSSLSDAIDPVYYDTSYYMVPDGEAGQDVYAVLREAIGRTGGVALSGLVE